LLAARSNRRIRMLALPGAEFLPVLKSP